MEKYCSYCSSKIFDKDRVCLQCGAPTINYIVLNEEKPYKEVCVKKDIYYGNKIESLDSFYPYSDIRVLSHGDSSCFEISERDIFCKVTKGRESLKTNLHRNFRGLIPLHPELSEFSTDNISELFFSAVSSFDLQAGFNVNRYSQAEFVRLSQTVGAWNGGRKSLIVGYERDFTDILPNDINYRYNLDFNIQYIKNFLGSDCILFPTPKVKSPYEFKNSGKIYIVSPTQNKLLKIVLEDESMKNIGIGLVISSIFAVINI